LTLKAGSLGDRPFLARKAPNRGDRASRARVPFISTSSLRLETAFLAAAPAALSGIRLEYPVEPAVSTNISGKPGNSTSAAPAAMRSTAPA